MSKLKVIQIGVGGFGQSWLKVVMESQHADLVAVVDLMAENLKKTMDITGIPEHACFNDPTLAFSSVNADIVLIVTPPQTHKELAEKALKSGLHVLMEKPLAHTLQEAQELLDISKSYRQSIAVSQNYRWRPPIQTAKQLLRRKVIGDIGYMEYQFRKARRFGGWRDQYTEILLEDMSIHHFDIMRFLLEKEPVEVFSQSFRPPWSWFNGNPSANLSILFEEGIRVSYFGSWVSRGKETTWNGDIRIVGDKGAIEIIDDQITLYSDYGDENREPTLQHIPIDEQLLHHDRLSSLNHFIEAVVRQKEPETDITDNIKSFRLTCAAIESAQVGEKVSLAHCKEKNSS